MQSDDSTTAPPPRDSDREPVEDVPASPDSRRDEPEDLPSGHEMLGTLFAESSLWPLLSVIIGSLGALMAALLVLALGDRNPFAAGALLLIVGMTLDIGIRSRRKATLRHLAKLLALLWSVGIALAIVARLSGIT